jgi:homoserine kinase
MKRAAQSKLPGRFRLRLPATSANLGPGFDAAALAFDLTLLLEANRAERYSIEARGRDTEICTRIENNLILDTYTDVLSQAGKTPVPLELRIVNRMPIGKGCGSSAAARLAGIALARHFGRLTLSDDQVITEASRREHHPDNASACWLGGVTVSRMTAETVQTIKILPKGKWPLLLVVPPEELATEKARQVLPATYSRADAVTNIQNSMLLLAALMQGRRDLLGSALQDRIHQPYRAPLCPLLPALQELVGGRGILGVALSGAGPSVLVFLDIRTSLAGVHERILAHLRGKRLAAELIATAISPRGAAAWQGSAAPSQREVI